MAELTKAEKEVNALTLEKAALAGFIYILIDELPSQKRRDYYTQKMAKLPFVKPIGWCDELPYTLE